jgi:hypothetical protein
MDHIGLTICNKYLLTSDARKKVSTKGHNCFISCAIKALQKVWTIHFLKEIMSKLNVDFKIASNTKSCQSPTMGVDM